MQISRFSPWSLAQSGTEHGEQAAFFCWCNMARLAGVSLADDPVTYSNGGEKINLATPEIPELEWLHSIPNGGERGRASAGNMKAEGVKAGVADIFWPVPVGIYHGLYIEMKRVTGRTSDVKPRQRDFRTFVLSNGYAWCWTPGWLIARERLIAYATGRWEERYNDL